MAITPKGAKHILVVKSNVALSCRQSRSDVFSPTVTGKPHIGRADGRRSNKKARPRPGFHKIYSETGSESVENLIGPETLETLKGAVERVKVFHVDAANLFDRSNMPIIQQTDNISDLPALVGQANAD